MKTNFEAPTDENDYFLQHNGDIHNSYIGIDPGEDVSLTGNMFGSKLHFGKK